MTITPPAGTYFCIFNSYGDGEFAIFVDGNIITESVRQVLNMTENINTCEIITVNGTETIDIRGRVINVSQRVLILYTVL